MPRNVFKSVKISKISKPCNSTYKNQLFTCSSQSESFDFCERLLQSIIHSTALPLLLKIPSKLEAITNITILFSEVFRNRIKSVFKSVICIQNAFGRAMTLCLRGRKGKGNPSSPNPRNSGYLATWIKERGIS